MKAALHESLESSMTKLGAGVDKLKVDLHSGSLLGLRQQTLPQSQNPLLGSNAATL